VRAGLKVGTIDWPVRWLVALLPVILFGLHPRFLERAGMRRLHADQVELDLGGSFIVDGEAFPSGRYLLEEGPQLTFIVP